MEQRKKILILDCENAHKSILRTFQLKDEVDIITGAYAVAYVPVDGAVNLNNFKEQDEFTFGIAGLQLNGTGACYAVPIEFTGIQGRAPEEEANGNFNKQITFAPLPINVQAPANAHLKVKYRDTLTSFRFKYNLKIILTYTEK